MKSIICFILLLISSGIFGQDNIEVPEILINSKGIAITSANEWEDIRRSQLLEIFEDQIYGRIPELNDLKVVYSVSDYSASALNGLARRKQINVKLCDKLNGKEMDFEILIYYPLHATGPVPLFLGLNFYGNHTIHSDPEIHISDSWVDNNENFKISNNKADERSRGIRTERWPVEYIVSRGYGIATIYCGDIDPDFHDDFKNGIHNFFYNSVDASHDPDEAGTIAAWAWGLSQAMNYFETDTEIDNKKIIVIGHSRLGKAALWAGAMDERFSIVISNNSGCGGAALSTRKFGETVELINTTFPHWFCDNFKKYNNKEEDLPVDQHMLLALIAPRPVYVASSQLDEWADPQGEYLSAFFASEVYKLYGLQGLQTKDMPVVNFPLKNIHTGYHIKSGKHDITGYDWEQYLDFADFHLIN